MQIEIDAPGIEDLLSRIQGVDARALANTIVDTAGPVLLNRVKQRFLAEQTPDGVAWLKSRAAIRRAALGLGGGTLFDTGTLFHSIQFGSIGEGKRTIGSDVPYGQKHQLGIGVVKRVWLGFSTEDISLVKLVANREVTNAMARLL